MESLKQRLVRLNEVVSRDCPELADAIPSPEGISMTKLGKHGVVMSDACNAAQATWRALQVIIGGVTYVIDCFHHLRNTWIKGMDKEVTEKLRTILADSLEEIPSELWVTCVISALCRAWDKFFSLSCNYPKGKGEHWAAWLNHNRPGIPLYHVEGAQGSRHDLCLMAAPAIYMNRPVCYDYADYLLKLPKTRDHKLLRNLFVLMTSEEMVAVAHLFSILYISFCMPMQWLAAKPLN